MADNNDEAKVKTDLVGMGARLSEARKDLGLTQSEMADNVGVSHRAYHSYEKGQRGIPIEVLSAAATGLGIDPAWVLLGSKTVRFQQDFDALKRIVIELDQLLLSENIELPSKIHGKIIAEWYRSFVEGKEASTDAVRTWIELVSD